MMNRTNKQAGTALILSFFITVTLLGAMVALADFSIMRTRTTESLIQHETLENQSMIGITRLQNLLSIQMKDQETGLTWIAETYTLETEASNWIGYQEGETNDFQTNQDGYFTIENIKIRCSLTKLEEEKEDKESWYLLTSQATNGKMSYQAQCTMKLVPIANPLIPVQLQAPLIPSFGKIKVERIAQ